MGAASTGVAPTSQDALWVSLGTNLRLAEPVGFDVGNVYLATGPARVRVRLLTVRSPVSTGLPHRFRAGWVRAPRSLATPDLQF